MNYKVGSIIEYETFTGQVRRVKVTGKDSDIKNGRPGFDGVIQGNGMSVWGYDSQITRVLEY